jgi:uncharacterized protein (TIGR03435 family)
MGNRIIADLNENKKLLLPALAIATIAAPIVAGLLTTPLSRAQTTAPNSFTGLQTVAEKKFDVATIKPGMPTPGLPDQAWRLGPPGHGGIDIMNLELKKIIASSFRIQDSMVFGPGWIASTRFNIVGKGPDPAVPNTVVWEMMRSLLVERFQMKYHLESRELPVYLLTIAKGGPKLGKAEEGHCKEQIKAGQTCGDVIFPAFGAGIYNMPIGALISGLARTLQDRPIVDRTGLTGKYDILVRWMPDNVKPEDLERLPREARPPDLSLFDALEQEVGLKLEATKAPVEVVVVDRIERPSEN